METLIFEVPDKEKAKALLQVAKVLGISVVASAKKVKANPKAEKAYNPEFVAKIEKGRQQIREGKTFTIELKDLWK